MRRLEPRISRFSKSTFYRDVLAPGFFLLSLLGFFSVLSIFLQNSPSFLFKAGIGEPNESEIMFYRTAAPIFTLLLPASLILLLKTRLQGKTAIALALLLPVFGSSFVFTVPVVHSTYLVDTRWDTHCPLYYKQDMWDSLGYTWFHKGFHSITGFIICY